MVDGALIKYLDSQEFLQVSSNSSRLVAKLKSAIERNELYETHQILRTIYFRFVISKEKVFALRNLLHIGACHLLKLEEYVSGQDIASIFLETSAKCLTIYQSSHQDETVHNLTNLSLSFHRNGSTIDYETSEMVSSIAIQLPDTEIGRQKFIAETLKILTPKLLNREILHHVLAREFWSAKDYASSRYHFLHCANSANAIDIANMLVEYQTDSANRSEVDLFIAQFVLQFLCLQSPLDATKTSNQKVNPSAATVTSRKSRRYIRQIAEQVFLHYNSAHPLLNQEDSSPPFSLPLLNFTYFIISLLDSNKDANTFRILCDIYKQTWSRDPSYQGYLTRIGSIYVGVVDEAAKQRQGGLFNNLLLSLLEDPDDDADEDSNQGATTISSCDELD